jgi:hypothetical protein
LSISTEEVQLEAETNTHRQNHTIEGRLHYINAAFAYHPSKQRGKSIEKILIM